MWENKKEIKKMNRSIICHDSVAMVCIKVVVVAVCVSTWEVLQQHVSRWWVLWQWELQWCMC